MQPLDHFESYRSIPLDRFHASASTHDEQKWMNAFFIYVEDGLEPIFVL